jgi:hypothetical protein
MPSHCKKERRTGPFANPEGAAPFELVQNVKNVTHNAAKGKAGIGKPLNCRHLFQISR